MFSHCYNRLEFLGKKEEVEKAIESTKRWFSKAELFYDSSKELFVEKDEAFFYSILFYSPIAEDHVRFLGELFPELKITLFYFNHSIFYLGKITLFQFEEEMEHYVLSDSPGEVRNEKKMRKNVRISEAVDKAELYGFGERVPEQLKDFPKEVVKNE
jgi:hypothetical protein